MKQIALLRVKGSQMSMPIYSLNQLQKKGKRNVDGSSVIIAKVFNCTPSYVRQIIADTKYKRYKGEKPAAIRKAYKEYVEKKREIINCL